MIHHLLNHTHWCPEHLTIALSTLAEDGLWKYSSQSRPAGTSHSITLFDKIDSQFTIFFRKFNSLFKTIHKSCNVLREVFIFMIKFTSQIDINVAKQYYYLPEGGFSRYSLIWSKSGLCEQNTFSTPMFVRVWLGPCDRRNWTTSEFITRFIPEVKLNRLQLGVSILNYFLNHRILGLLKAKPGIWIFLFVLILFFF